MPVTPPTWTYENRNQRVARQSAQFAELMAQVKPWVASGDIDTARAIVQQRIPEAAPKPVAAPKPKGGGGLLGSLKDFGGEALHVGKVIGENALSGEKFQDTLGIDTSYMDSLRRHGLLGKAAAFALDTATAPATLATLGFGAQAGAGLKLATAGTRLARAGELGSALLSPAIEGPLARRAAAEVAAGTGANLAGEYATTHLPEGTPAPVRLGVGLGAGLVGGAASLHAPKVGRALAEGTGIAEMYREGAVPGAGMVMIKGAPKGTPVGEPYAGRPVIADSLLHGRDNTAKAFGLSPDEEVALNDQLTLHRRMDGGYELVDENSTIPITDSEDLSGLLGANSPLGPATTRAPRPLANERLWFHSTRDMNFDLPDPDLAVGTQTGITQGPGIYMAADPAKSAGHYGPRTFAAEFDGNTLDLTAKAAPDAPMFEGGATWREYAQRVADRLNAAGVRVMQEAQGPSNAELAKRMLAGEDISGLRSTGVGGPRLLTADDLLVKPSGKTPFTVAEAKTSGSGYSLRDRIAANVGDLLADATISKKSAQGLAGRFKSLGDSAPTREVLAKALVNDEFANSGVDALFHHSPRADGDVLIVLNGEKARVLGDVRNAPDVIKNGKTWAEMRDAVSTEAEAAKAHNNVNTVRWNDKRTGAVVGPDGSVIGTIEDPFMQSPRVTWNDGRTESFATRERAEQYAQRGQIVQRVEPDLRDYAIGGGAGRALDAGIGDTLASKGLNPTAYEPGVRPGELLRPRGEDQLGPDFTPKQAMDVAADLARTQSAQANRLRSIGELEMAKIGRVDDSGHLLDVTPSAADVLAGMEHPSFYDVIQNPGAYHLSDAQLEGLSGMAAIIQRVRQEREAFGVGPNVLQIEGDGDYFHRLAKADTSGNRLRKGGGGGGQRMGANSEKSRMFATAREAEQAGVRYAHPLESLDDYVARGLKTAADAHVKSLLTRFGETAVDRMDPTLRDAYQGAVKDVASIRGRLNTALRRAKVATGTADELDRAIEDVRARVPTGAGSLARVPGIVEREADRAANLRVEKPAGTPRPQRFTQRADTIDSVVRKLEQAIPGDTDRIRYLENAIDRSRKRVDELRTRGGSHAIVADQLEADLIAATTRLNDLRPEYQAALERAKQVPAGRQAVDSRIAPALIGRDFEPDVAKRIANFYGRDVTPQTTQLGRAKTAAKAVNTAITPIRATADVSSMLNQQGRMAVNNPVTYLRNVARSFKDLADDAGYHTFMASPRAQRAARAGIALLGDAGERNEFQFSNWIERIPVAGQVAKIANKHFVRFNNRMRVDVFDAITEANARLGKAFDARAEEELAKGINRMSGVSTGRAGDAETLGMFAPNFFRSHLENLAHALPTDKSIEGQFARRYLGTFFGAGMMTVGAAAVASGRDPAEVMNPLDMDALERGEVRLNPNFGTVRVNGQDVQMFGPYTSLMRLAAIGTDATVRSLTEKDAMQLFDALGYAASTKGSPLVGLGTDLIKGETFSGQDPLSLGANIERFTPISISNAIAAHSQGLSWQDAAFDSIANAIGAQSNPMSPTERLNSISQSVVDPETGQPNGKDFYDSSPAVRQEIKEQNPTLWRDAVDAGSQKRQQYEEAKMVYRTQQEADNNLLLSGKITRQQWANQRDNRRQQLIGQGMAIYGDGDRVKTGDKVLDAFYQQIADSTVNGAPQWDAVYNWVDSLPEKDRLHIETNTGLNQTPVEKLVKSLSGDYYSLPQYRGYTADEGKAINELLTEVYSRAPGGNDVRQLAALRKLVANGGYDDRVVKAARRKILGYLADDTKRKQYAKAHPELALVTRQGTLTPVDIAAITKALEAA